MTNEPDNRDPIIEEVRKAREAYAAKFNFDLDAMITDLQRRTEERRRSGHPVLSLPPAQRAG